MKNKMTFTKREVKERMYNDYIYKQNQIIHFNFQNKIWFIVLKKKNIYIYKEFIFIFDSCEIVQYAF